MCVYEIEFEEDTKFWVAYLDGKVVSKSKSLHMLEQELDFIDNMKR